MGRYATSAFFRYFCDVTSPVEDQPGNIVIRNCRVENVGRLFKYNFGAETWQQGRQLADIRFENVKATGIELPIALNAGDRPDCTVPLDFTMKDCSIGFSRPQDEVFSAVGVRTLALTNVTVGGVSADTPIVRSWGGVPPALAAERVEGARLETAKGNGRYRCVR